MYKILVVSSLALLAVGCSDNSSNKPAKMQSNGTSQNAPITQNPTTSQTNTPNTTIKIHPEASLKILKDYAKQDTMVLDIGSGSGIGPRQLIANGFNDVVVVESDDQMINDAKEANMHDKSSVKYIAGDLEKGLPYPDGKFGLVTAFSAFHCYASPASIKEMYRLLKPQGYLFIIRGLEKNSDPVRIKTTKIIEEISGQKIPSINIDSIKMLKDQGFEIVLDTTVPVVEYFTKNEYLNYMKSYCSWNYAKKSPKQADIEKKIGDYLDTLADKDGVIRIEIKAPVILAKKPAK